MLVIRTCVCRVCAKGRSAHHQSNVESLHFFVSLLLLRSSHYRARPRIRLLSDRSSTTLHVRACHTIHILCRSARTSCDFIARPPFCVLRSLRLASFDCPFHSSTPYRNCRVRPSEIPDRRTHWKILLTHPAWCAIFSCRRRHVSVKVTPPCGPNGTYMIWKMNDILSTEICPFLFTAQFFYNHERGIMSDLSCSTYWMTEFVLWIFSARYKMCVRILWGLVVLSVSAHD